MFPVILFALLTTKYSAMISRIGDTYMVAAILTSKFLDDRDARRRFFVAVSFLFVEFISTAATAKALPGSFWLKRFITVLARFHLSPLRRFALLAE